MDKKAKIMMYIWMVLAIISLVSTFFLPSLFFKIAGWIFGAMNILIGVAFHVLLKNNDNYVQLQKISPITDSEPSTSIDEETTGNGKTKRTRKTKTE